MKKNKIIALILTIVFILMSFTSCASFDSWVQSAKGSIIGAVWIGDHYQYIVRNENEDDFVCNTPYAWNIGDKVSIKLPVSKISLRLKKGLDNYVVR